MERAAPPEGGFCDTVSAIKEAREWIEAMTRKRFSSGSFRESLEDGVLLCELMESLSPGSIRKINHSRSPMAHLDNIQQFLLACKDLGLREEQLFDMMDLQDPQATQAGRGEGEKRAESQRRVRSVCVTLYWLGRTVADTKDYAGPQLDLGAFRTLLCHEPGSDGSSSTSDLHNHSSGVEEGENGFGLTAEEEQTADQLLADIQSAVDEMLQDFHTNTLDMEEPPPSPHAIPTAPPSEKWEGVRVSVSVHMKSQGAGFGFQVSGGVDTGQPAQVDMVLPGSAAEASGLRQEDEIVSVDHVDVAGLTHHQLVSTIRRAGREGQITMGLLRTLEGEGRSLPRFDDEAEWQEEKERQAQELIRAHPKHHRYLEGSGPTLTPVLEEEIGNNVGESPLPPLPVVSPEMSAVLEARSSVKELQELEEMMGKESVTPSLSSASETSPVPLVAEKQEAAPSPPLSSPLPTTTQSPDGHQVSSVVRRGDVDVGGGEEGSGKGGAVGDTGTTEREGNDGEVGVRDGVGSGVGSGVEVGGSEGEPQLTTEELESIIRELQESSPVAEAVHPESEEKEEVSRWPWEPQTQWEDKKKEEKGKEEDERVKKIWSFLEEKTRLSAEEMTHSVVVSNLATEQPPPRKSAPPKVLPKPARKKERKEEEVVAQPSLPQKPSLSQHPPKEQEPLVSHVNGPIPSPDPHTITIQSTSSREPLNIRSVTPEEVELHGDIKIQKVAHTRWTPPMQGKDHLLRAMSSPTGGFPLPPVTEDQHLEPHPPQPRPYEETVPHVPGQPQHTQDQRPRPYEESQPTGRHYENMSTHPTHRHPLRHQPHSMPQQMPRPQQRMPHPQQQVPRPQQPQPMSRPQQYQVPHPQPMPRPQQYQVPHPQQLQPMPRPQQYQVPHPHQQQVPHPHHQQQGPRPQQWVPRAQQLPLQTSHLAEQTRVRRGHESAVQSGQPYRPGHAPQARGRLQSAAATMSHDGFAGPHRAAPQQPPRVDVKARSRTWGPRERNQFLGKPSQMGRPALALPDKQRQDGLQQAFLVHPADPHLPCSSCKQPLGTKSLMAIPGLHLHYHQHCFACSVCRSALTPASARSTTVIVRHMLPHCHFCTSDSRAGVQATEC